MKEAEVCTRIVNTINDAGHWAYKIPDSPAIMGKYSREKAVDIVAGINGGFVAIEVKINPSLPKKLTSFINLFRDSQIKHLDKITSTFSGRAYTMLCVFKNNRKASLRRHDLYVIHWGVLKAYGWQPEKLQPVKYSKGRYDLKEFTESIGYPY